jgi:ABC-type sugar transport system substrate-binding protein
MVPVMIYATPLAQPKLAVGTTLAEPTQGAIAGGRLMCNLIGNSGHVLLLEAALGNPNTTARWTGFKQGLAENCPKVTVVSELTSNEQTTAASDVQSAVNRYSDLKGVFADDIVNADGAVTGLKAAGKLGQIKIGAFDAEPSEVAALKAGTIQFLVAQKPLEEGELAIKDLWLHAHGQKVPSFVNVGTVLTTKQNLPQTSKWEY